VQVNWVKCGGGANWCPFQTVNLDGVDTEGVYMIWHEGNPGRVVYVGQGDVADRLCNHRKDKRITKYSENGTLRVTWAYVSSAQLDGVERYLADTWSPLIGDLYPDVLGIAVNSPWS
jgi:hypothetical protein